MGVNATEFEAFEQQFLKLIGELQSITSSESHLREALRAEATRTEAAEAARDAAARAAAEARGSAAAATAATAQASTALAKLQDELVATKMRSELAERHRVILEEKCSELSSQLESANRELERLRAVQPALSNLQRQYVELQKRIQNATSDARRETGRLESELRRVEKCASGGAELRDRARLAAAAHVRERRMAAAELQHTSQELHNSRAEVTRLGALVAELQCRLSDYCNDKVHTKITVDPNIEALTEARSALEAERIGTARLERALAAAAADNAALAAQLHTSDNATALVVEAPSSSPTPIASASTTNCPIDSFLAD